MSTIGKVCLSIALLLWLLLLVPIPGVWGGWGPKLLVVQNNWASEIRDARTATENVIQQEAKARRELNAAITDVQAITFGWDKFWNVPARGQGDPRAPRITKQPNGRLVVDNLGKDQGIADVTEMVNGKPELVQPVFHAFFGGANGETYAGEFTAMNITANRMELAPVHQNPVQFIQTWDVNAAWRLRTMIPVGARTTLDGLYRQRRRLNQLTTELNAAVAKHQGLLQSAQTGLETREGELLGNPANEAIENRPEFKDGLLLVTELTEEERNQLALEVDTLRRQILVEIENRDAQIEELRKLIDNLPSDNNTAQIARASDVPSEER